MTDKEVLEQEDVQVDVVDKKPALVFEDEFEIIPEDSVVDEPVAASEPDIEALVAERLAQMPKNSTNDELAEVLKNLNKTLTPKDEPVKPIDWEKFYEEQAEELSNDPKKAVKSIVETLAGQFGSAFQQQNAQIVESQKETSKLLAKGDPSLSVVFEHWGAEVDEMVAKTPTKPGQSAVQIYNEAARQVKLEHIDDLLELKMQEFAQKQATSAPLSRSKTSSTPGAPPIEGEPQRARYTATQAQLNEINRSINPDLLRAKMIREGKLKRIS